MEKIGEKRLQREVLCLFSQMLLLRSLVENFIYSTLFTPAVNAPRAIHFFALVVTLVL